MRFHESNDDGNDKSKYDILPWRPAVEDYDILPFRRHHIYEPDLWNYDDGDAERLGHPCLKCGVREVKHEEPALFSASTL